MKWKVVKFCLWTLPERVIDILGWFAVPDDYKTARETVFGLTLTSTQIMILWFALPPAIIAILVFLFAEAAPPKWLVRVPFLKGFVDVPNSSELSREAKAFKALAPSIRANLRLIRVTRSNLLVLAVVRLHETYNLGRVKASLRALSRQLEPLGIQTPRMAFDLTSMNTWIAYLGELLPYAKFGDTEGAHEVYRKFVESPDDAQ